MLHRYTLLPLLLLGLIRPLAAQELLPVGFEFLVNQHIPDQQSLPHVASDEEGGYVVIWRSWNQGGSGGNIWARRFGADHQPVTDEFQVSTGLGSNNRAYVYHWGEGRFALIWTTGSPPGNANLRVLNADNTLEDAQTLGVPHDFDAHIRGDEMLFAYTSNQHVYLRKWDLLANAMTGPAVQASEAPSANYQLPQVRWTSTGGIVAVYRGGPSTPHHIYRKSFNGNLLAQTPEASVHSTNGSLGVINISINALDQLLIYARYGVNGIDVFVGLVLDAAGSTLVTGVGSTSAPYAYYYTDCELFDSGALVQCNNYKTSLSDPLDYCVRANYALFLGAPSTGFQFASTTTSGPQRYPAMTKLPGDGFLMVWNGNGFQGDSDGIYARAFAGADFPTATPHREAQVPLVLPNPFRDHLVVGMEQAAPLEVLDASGRVVHTALLQPGPNAMQLDALAPGIYLLAWHAADGTRLTHRVVKE